MQFVTKEKRIQFYCIYVTQFIIKVEVMNKADKSQKAETAFKLFDKNRDGYITREEFTKVFIF